MAIISDMIREIREWEAKVAEQKKEIALLMSLGMREESRWCQHGTEQREKIAVLEEENKSQKEKIAVLEEEARQMRRWCGIAEEQKEEIAVLEEEARQGRAKERTWKGERARERTWTKGQEDYPVAVWGKEQEPKEPDLAGEFTSCDCGDDFAICEDCNSPKCTCCGLCECSFECKCYQHLGETNIQFHETKCFQGWKHAASKAGLEAMRASGATPG
jgi:hypothetical protein